MQPSDRLWHGTLLCRLDCDGSSAKCGPADRSTSSSPLALPTPHSLAGCCFKRMTAFRRFVQVGRVVLINYGPEEGKLAVIVDVVDQSRVLVFGPSESGGVTRQVINLRRVSLTDMAFKLGRGARAKSVKAAWAAADVEAKWAASSWGKKLAGQRTKAAASDLDRFAAMLTKKAAAKKVRAALGK